MKRRILNVFIALDQLLFCFATLGHSSPDETLSAAAWRWEQSGKLAGRVLRPLIDALFWFDRNHCQTAFESERDGRHLPPEYREVKQTKGTKHG
ncbi:MAG: hypothetical protein ACMV1D_00765 [Macromonas sp.]